MHPLTSIEICQNNGTSWFPLHSDDVAAISALRDHFSPNHNSNTGGIIGRNDKDDDEDHGGSAGKAAVFNIVVVANHDYHGNNGGQPQQTRKKPQHHALRHTTLPSDILDPHLAEVAALCFDFRVNCLLVLNTATGELISSNNNCAHPIRWYCDGIRGEAATRHEREQQHRIEHQTNLSLAAALRHSVCNLVQHFRSLNPFDDSKSKKSIRERLFHENEHNNFFQDENDSPTTPSTKLVPERLYTAPNIIEDLSLPACLCCGAAFGVLRWRHTCRSFCGGMRQFCAECVSNMGSSSSSSHQQQQHQCALCRSAEESLMSTSSRAGTPLANSTTIDLLETVFGELVDSRHLFEPVELNHGVNIPRAVFFKPYIHAACLFARAHFVDNCKTVIATSGNDTWVADLQHVFREIDDNGNSSRSKSHSSQQQQQPNQQRHTDQRAEFYLGELVRACAHEAVHLLRAAGHGGSDFPHIECEEEIQFDLRQLHGATAAATANSTTVAVHVDLYSAPPQVALCWLHDVVKLKYPSIFRSGDNNENINSGKYKLDTILRLPIVDALRRAAAAVTTLHNQHLHHHQHKHHQEKQADEEETAEAFPILFDMLEILKHHKELGIDRHDWLAALVKLGQKLASLADHLDSTSLDDSGNKAWDSWERQLCRAQFTGLRGNRHASSSSNEAVNGICAVFLFTVEQGTLCLYRRVNEALHDDHHEQQQQQQQRQLFLPIAEQVNHFLTVLGGSPQILFRGECFGRRIIDELNNNKDSSSNGSSSSPQGFTSASSDFAVAHRVFRSKQASHGSNSSFVIFETSRAVSISPFSCYDNASEFLLPAGAVLDVIHRVPLSHLALTNRRFDVVHMRQSVVDNSTQHNRNREESSSSDNNNSNAFWKRILHSRRRFRFGVPAAVRVQLALAANRAVSRACSVIESFFIPPRLTLRSLHGREDMPLLDAVSHLLSSNTTTSATTTTTWLTISSGPAQGKTSLGVFLATYLNNNHLRLDDLQQDQDQVHVDALFISLPEVGGPALFEADGLEKAIQQRLHLSHSQEATLEQLRQRPLLVVFDALDEVVLAQPHWPTDAQIGSSLTPARWPYLRVVLTCRTEFLERNNIELATLTGNRNGGVVATILPFGTAEVTQMLAAWLPGERDQFPGAELARDVVIRDCVALPEEHRNPFVLYLLCATQRSSLPAGVVDDNDEQQETDETEAATTTTIRSLQEAEDRDAMQRSMALKALGCVDGEGVVASPLSPTSPVRIKKQQQRRMQTDDFWESLEHPSSSNNVVENSEGESIALCAVYENGIRALIKQNVMHLFFEQFSSLSSSNDQQQQQQQDKIGEIVDVVFEWCEHLAVFMLADRVTTAWFDSYSNELCDAAARCLFYELDPELHLFMLAPLRINGHDATAQFEWRHRSIAEFLVARVKAVRCTSMRVADALDRIDWSLWPNATAFVELLQLRQQKKQKQPNSSSGVNLLNYYVDKQTTMLPSAESLARFLLDCGRTVGDNSSNPPPRVSISHISKSKVSSTAAEDFNAVLMATDAAATSTALSSAQLVSRLTHLDLGHVDADLCQILLDSIATEVTLSGPRASNLESLRLCHPCVCDETVESIIRACGPHSLRCISLPGTRITRRTARLVAQYCRDDLLVAFDVSDCRLVDQIFDDATTTRTTTTAVITKFAVSYEVNDENNEVTATIVLQHALRDIQGHDDDYDSNTDNNSSKRFLHWNARLNHSLSNNIVRYAPQQDLEKLLLHDTLNYKRAAVLRYVQIPSKLLAAAPRLAGTTHNSLVSLSFSPSPSSSSSSASPCPPLRDTTLIQLCTAHGLGLPVLTALDVSHCIELSDDALIQGVARHCPRLRSLNVQSCNRIGDRGVRAVVLALRSNSSSGQLESLLLDHTQVTDSLLEILSSSPHSQALLTLSVAGCGAITDQGLLHILCKCHLLRHLILDGTTRVTARTVGAIGRPEMTTSAANQQHPHRNNEFTTLSFEITDPRDKIGEDHFVHLAQRCAALRNLNLKGHLVSLQAMGQIQTAVGGGVHIVCKVAH